jgi:RNase H-fold protein (predicted Holliday junction resolvase)
MSILGIDYGERYIGCAISTSKTNIPFALKIIDTKTSNIIQSLISIIGLNNNETRMSKLVDFFIEETLVKKMNLDVTKVDERMTSSVVTRSKKERIDDISALKILETYLYNV